jgi:hypothetical protein
MTSIHEISLARMVNQQIGSSAFSSPARLVQYMGAIQAQDFPMARWGVGARLKEPDEAGVSDTFDKGEILRTHLLRPTWHLVHREDIRWMLDLTAPRIRATARSRWKQLGLDPDTFRKCNSIIEALLGDQNYKTREEILTEVGKHIPVMDQRGAHILLQAELEGIICSGPARKAKQTYALLQERVPEFPFLTKEESLAKLAERYFTSHGPATLMDFVWWSGLTVSDARKGLETAMPGLVNLNVLGNIYWVNPSTGPVQRSKDADSVFLLPAYDEFLISYKDRTPSIAHPDQKHAFSNNGIFRPVVVVNGVVSGIWRRTFRNGTVMLEVVFFNTPSEAVRDALLTEANRFGCFLNMKSEVIIR